MLFVVILIVAEPTVPVESSTQSISRWSWVQLERKSDLPSAENSRKSLADISINFWVDSEASCQCYKTFFLRQWRIGQVSYSGKLLKHWNVHQEQTSSPRFYDIENISQCHEMFFLCQWWIGQVSESVFPRQASQALKCLTGTDNLTNFVPFSEEKKVL